MKHTKKNESEIIETIEAGWNPQKLLRHENHSWNFYLKVIFNLLGLLVFFTSLSYTPFIETIDARTPSARTCSLHANLADK